jgi:hypothetical protein
MNFNSNLMLELERALLEILPVNFIEVYKRSLNTGIFKAVNAKLQYVNGTSVVIQDVINESVEIIQPIDDGLAYNNPTTNLPEFNAVNKKRTYKVDLAKFYVSKTIDLHKLIETGIGGLQPDFSKKDLIDNINSYILQLIQSVSLAYAETIHKMVADMITTGTSNFITSIQWSIAPDTLFNFAGINTNFSSATVNPLLELEKMYNQISAQPLLKGLFNGATVILGEEAWRKFYFNPNVQERIKYFEMSAYPKEDSVIKYDFSPVIHRMRHKNIDIYEVTPEARLKNSLSSYLINPDDMVFMLNMPENVIVFSNKENYAFKSNALFQYNIEEAIRKDIDKRALAIDYYTNSTQPNLVTFVARVNLGIVLKYPEAVGVVNIT